MAKKVCDLCQQSAAAQLRFGVNLCNDCSIGYDKAILGDTAFADRFSDPSNFPNATPLAQKNIIAFVAKQCKQQELELTTEEKEQKWEEYVHSFDIHHKKDVKKADVSLDSLYTDIGKKIKRWAKWLFIIGAAAAVISGISVLFAAENGGEVVTALLTLVLGPVVAWVSSWLLYAFGELVDKTAANERNTQNILKILLENNSKSNEE